MGLGLGPWEIVLILLVLLLVFGARRLPELGSALGKGIREFKSSISSIQSDITTPPPPPPPQVKPPEQTGSQSPQQPTARQTESSEKAKQS